MDEMMQRAHVGPAIDPSQNRQSKLSRQPIVRTVSKISNKSAPKGECPRVHHGGK